jgi:hypothetical protein
MKPTSLGGQFLLKAEHILALFVVLINEQKILIEKVTDLRSRQHFEINVSKLTLKVALIHKG